MVRLAGEKSNKRVNLSVGMVPPIISRSIPAGDPIVREVGHKVHFAEVHPLAIKLNRARKVG